MPAIVEMSAFARSRLLYTTRTGFLLWHITQTAMGRLFALRPPRPPWRMDRWFAIAGIVCLVVSVTGQAFTWGGAQLNAITSPLTRVGTFILGVVLIGLSFFVQVGGRGKDPTGRAPLPTEETAPRTPAPDRVANESRAGADSSPLSAALTGTVPKLLLDEHAQFVGEPYDVTAAVIQIKERIEQRIEPIYEFAMRDAAKFATRFQELEALDAARTPEQSDERLFHVQATKKWMNDKETFDRAVRIGLRAQQLDFFQTDRTIGRPYMSAENLTQFILGIRDVIWGKESREVQWWLWRKASPSFLRSFGLLSSDAEDMKKYPPPDAQPGGLQSWAAAYSVLYFDSDTLWRRVLPMVALAVTSGPEEEASDRDLVNWTNLVQWQFSLDDPRHWRALPDG
jgi:hypothetical protein